VKDLSTIREITGNIPLAQSIKDTQEAIKAPRGLMLNGSSYIETIALPLSVPTHEKLFGRTYSVWLYAESRSGKPLIVGDANLLMQLGVSDEKVTLRVRFEDRFEDLQDSQPLPLKTWVQYTGVVTYDPSTNDASTPKTALTLYRQGDEPQTKTLSGIPAPIVSNSSFSEAEILPLVGQPGDWFGCAVAISGATAIVGAAGDAHQARCTGAAYIFEPINHVWTQTAKLLPANAQAHIRFGMSVAIDGDTAIVGAPHNSDQSPGAGAAYIFERSGGIWAQSARLLPAETQPCEQFGCSVAIHGDLAIVGAHHHEASQDDDEARQIGKGTAYIFQRREGTWAQVAQLSPSDGRPYDLLGPSVAIDGDTAIVATRCKHNADQDTFAAYIFKLTDDTWTQTAKLLPSTKQLDSWFGCSVAIDGGTAVIGAFREGKTGAAYIFDQSNDSWAEAAKLLPPDEQRTDMFGSSVSIDGDRVIISANDIGEHGSSTGVAYVFHKNGDTWELLNKLSPTQTDLENGTATAVAIHQNQVILGISISNKQEKNSGSVYLFDSSPKLRLGHSLNGILAHASLWDQALSPEDVKHTANKILTGNETGLIGYWPLDQITSHTPKQVVDHTPYENNGIVYGDPQIKMPERCLHRKNHGESVTAFSSDEVVPVNAQVIYRESFEFKLSPSPKSEEIKPDNLFKFSYWGKPSQASQHRIREGFIKFVADAIEPLDGNWYRATGYFTVPEKAKFVRAFELNVEKDSTVNWETLTLRNHSIDEYREILSFYLKFSSVPSDSQVTEISGEQQQGQLRGAEPANMVTQDSEFRTCMTFDGNDDYIEFANAKVPVQNEPYTIEVWIKPDAMGDQCILGWGDPANNNSANLLNLTPTGIRNSWDQRNTAPVAKQKLDDGEWHHVAATFDGETRRVYIDGEPGAEDTPPQHAVLANTNTTLFIGKGGSLKPFKGKIAMVRIWGKALTQDAIQRYQTLDRPQKAPPPDPYLQLHLRLSELRQGLKPETREVQDFSGHERHGLLEPVGTAPTLVADDHFGSCLNFDSDSSSIAVESFPSIPENRDFTIELSVKPDPQANPAEATILQWGDALKIVQTGQTWKLTLQGKTTITFDATAQLGTIADGNWHQLAITYSHQLSEVSIYYDQTWVASKTVDDLGQIGSPQPLEIAPEN
jgi:hypothetical protein